MTRAPRCRHRHPDRRLPALRRCNPRAWWGCDPPATPPCDPLAGIVERPPSHDAGHRRCGLPSDIGPGCGRPRGRAPARPGERRGSRISADPPGQRIRTKSAAFDAGAAGAARSKLDLRGAHESWNANPLRPPANSLPWRTAAELSHSSRRHPCTPSWRGTSRTPRSSGPDRADAKLVRSRMPRPTSRPMPQNIRIRGRIARVPRGAYPLRTGPAYPHPHSTNQAVHDACSVPLRGGPDPILETSIKSSAASAR